MCDRGGSPVAQIGNRYGATARIRDLGKSVLAVVGESCRLAADGARGHVSDCITSETRRARFRIVDRGQEKRSVVVIGPGDATLDDRSNVAQIVAADDKIIALWQINPGQDTLVRVAECDVVVSLLLRQFV